VVFDSVEDMTLRVDNPDLDVTADDVLVLRKRRSPRARRHAGGRLSADPEELGRAGVKDMVRISDCGG